jgi:hypothetical protein
MSTVGSLGSLSPAPTSPDPSHPPTPKSAAPHPSRPAEPVESDSELSELTDEADNDDADNSNSQRSTSSKPVRGTVRRKRSNIVPPEPWGWAYKGGKKPGEINAEEEEEEEEHTGPPRAMEEEEDEDNGERAGSRRRAIDQGARADPVAPDDVPIRGDDEDASSNVSEDDLEVEDKDVRDDAGSPELTDEDVSDAEAEEDDGPSGTRTPADAQEVESESEADGEDAEAETEEEDVDVDEDAEIRAAAVLAITVAEGNVDVTAPPPSAIQPTVEKAATLSIMAGASAPTLGVANPESPLASTNSTPSSSRSPTPEPGMTSKSKRKKSSEEDQPSAKAVPKNKPQEEKEDQVDAEDAEVDEPELEMEMELQPAHRAEALDAIAVIELKFATLREQLYIEKMQALAWEEALVNEGVSNDCTVVVEWKLTMITEIHPEMLHLREELSKRRDRRLELASRRRAYEIANAARKRKADEDLAWSTWKVRSTNK